MFIESNEFKIESGASSARYDLYLKKTINKGKKDKEREDWVVEGYDMTLPSIFNKLSHTLTDSKIDKCDLKTYIREYRETVNYLNSIIKTENL